MSVTEFKANLKVAALARQAELFAQADEHDSAARREQLFSRRRARFAAMAAELRDEAARVGDRYFELVAA